MPSTFPSAKLTDAQGWIAYRTKFQKPGFCSEAQPCSLSVSQIGDAAWVGLNGSALDTHGGLPPHDRYAAHYPVQVSLPANSFRAAGEANELLILVRYLKKAQAGILRGPVAIVKTDAAFSLSRRTLSQNVLVPLVTGLGTLILGLLTFLGIIFSQIKDPKIGAYFRYCLTSALFLISYTCIPREYLPLSLTGCAHFMLRFSMDWSFLELAYALTGFRPGFVRLMRPVYAVCLLVFVGQYALESVVPRASWVGFTGAVSWSRQIDYVLIFGAYLYGAVAAYRNRLRLGADILAAFGMTSVLSLMGCLTFHGATQLPQFVMFYPFFIALIVGVEVWSGRLRQAECLRQEAIIGHVTHDIVHNLKTPIASLWHDLEQSIEIPPTRLRRMREVCGRIGDMVNGIVPYANSLLAQEATGETEKESGIKQVKMETLHLASLLEEIVSVERIAINHRMAISLNLEQGISLFATINSLEFKQALTNILDNAVDASPPEATIEVSLYNEGEEAVIAVADHGCGIPQENLARLGERGFTFGKENGSGQGLHHALSVIRNAKGRIEIHSEQGSGSRVEIRVPQANVPEWFAGALELGDSSRCIVLDDEEGVGEIWKSRLSAHDAPCITFISRDDADGWLRAHLLPTDILLFDHDLGESTTGLDCLAKYSEIHGRYLVTSHFGNVELATRALAFGVKMFPKSTIDLVPINRTGSKVVGLRIDLTEAGMEPVEMTTPR